jgi:hypothetical protein
MGRNSVAPLQATISDTGISALRIGIVAEAGAACCATTKKNRERGKVRCGNKMRLFGAEEGVAEEEEDAEDPDEGADFAVAACPDFDEGEREEAEA